MLKINTKLNWKFYTQEVNSVGYHKQFLKYLSIVFNHKFSYASMIIDPFINGFSTNDVKVICKFVIPK